MLLCGFSNTNDGVSTGQALYSRCTRIANSGITSSSVMHEEHDLGDPLVPPLLAIDRRGRKHLAHRQAQVLARRQRQRALRVELRHAGERRFQVGPGQLRRAGRRARRSCPADRRRTRTAALARLDGWRIRPGDRADVDPVVAAQLPHRGRRAAVPRRRCRAARPARCRSGRSGVPSPAIAVGSRRDEIAEVAGGGFSHFACPESPSPPGRPSGSRRTRSRTAGCRSRTARGSDRRPCTVSPSSAAIVAVSVCTRSSTLCGIWFAWPVAISTAIVSPIARPTPSSTAASSPFLAAGNNTRYTISQRLAPSASAASRYESGTALSASSPTDTITGTLISARMMPRVRECSRRPARRSPR